MICNTVFQNTDRFIISQKQFCALLKLSAKKSTLPFLQNKLYPTRRVWRRFEIFEISKIFEHFFLAHHEKKWLEQCPTYFRPVSHHGYVADTLFLIALIMQKNPWLPKPAICEHLLYPWHRIKWSAVIPGPLNFQTEQIIYVNIPKTDIHWPMNQFL